MRCAEIQEWLSLWLDDQITADGQAQLQRHLQECPACRQLVEQWIRAREALRHYPVVTPSADFDARVWQAIARRRTPAWSLSAWRRIALSAAMGMLLAISLLGAMWWHTPRQRATTPVLWLGGYEAIEWAQTWLTP